MEQTSPSWEFWFGLVQRYVDEHGTALVLQAHVTDDGDQLGTWVTTRRLQRSKGA